LTRIGPGRRVKENGRPLYRGSRTQSNPVLFRHSPGMILHRRTYSKSAVRLLRERGVKFTEVKS
jgi:hypothetical protein